MARNRSQSEALGFAEPVRAPRKRKDVTLSVYEEQWDALQMIAVRSRTTRSAIIQGLVDAYIEEHGGLERALGGYE